MTKNLQTGLSRQACICFHHGRLDAHSRRSRRKLTPTHCFLYDITPPPMLLPQTRIIPRPPIQFNPPATSSTDDLARRDGGVGILCVRISCGRGGVWREEEDDSERNRNGAWLEGSDWPEWRMRGFGYAAPSLWRRVSRVGAPYPSDSPHSWDGSDPRVHCDLRSPSTGLSPQNSKTWEHPGRPQALQKVGSRRKSSVELELYMFEDVGGRRKREMQSRDFPHAI
ncbi:hypothetical protein FB45DRAFT_864493 [Roridomyces roridus]|uniref:Uncharacterized protein n=1 Tax=Roridomyces roridus TaxID=1738132 RepID=A0AAD7C163_9AGAR|nr:hypothetical protein FB45DRAFT_864493 [Roridomyces roridus]